jgi:hypothetical protein
LSNFASVETSPLCVGFLFECFLVQDTS